MNELHLFAGGGGGILGGMLLGHSCVCAVELEPYCRRILLQRQRDGILPRFPIWDDVRTFEGRPWRGLVDVVCGGFPCQDISAAGRGAGITGERSGLWTEMARIIGEVRPAYAFVENSPNLTCRGIGTVLGDLAALGYDARWGVVSAADAIWLGGTPCLDHLRARIWIKAAYSHRERLEERRAAKSVQPEHASAELCGEADADAAQERRGERREEREGWAHVLGRRSRSAGDDDGDGNKGAHWWQSESSLARVVHGVAHRVDRIAALGNGQVPAVVALAWRLLSEPEGSEVA